MPTTAERFWTKVDMAGPSCWLWTAALNTGGYGHFQGRGAHRVAYEWQVGPIPPGLQLDHLCRVRNCVRPDHLEPVTPDENNRRKPVVPLRTHCKWGHEFTPENTYVHPRHGTRHCRRCNSGRGVGMNGV